MTRYAFLTYVPFTGPWRVHRGVTAWVDKAEATVREVIPGVPPFPRPIPRDPRGERLAVESVMALLQATHSGLSGGDPGAVFLEHMPDQAEGPVRLQTGKVRIIVALKQPQTKASIVRFDDKECGLYLQRAHFGNDFGTPLAARGTRAELDEFVAKYAR